MDAKTIGGIAAAIGVLIKIIADAIGAPVADVRKRVLEQVEADATDETDDILTKIDAASER